MKRNIAILALVAAAAALVSCNENKGYELNVPPTVDVTSGANITFKAIGGSGAIEVGPSEGQLQATTAQDSWCHLSVSGNRIDVTVDTYDGLESRYAIIDLKAGNATGKTIVQQFGVIVKSFDWKDFTVKNERQTVEFPYDANGSIVQATSDQDWVTFESTPEVLTIHIAQNPGTDYRAAENRDFTAFRNVFVKQVLCLDPVADNICKNAQNNEDENRRNYRKTVHSVSEVDRICRVDDDENYPPKGEYRRTEQKSFEKRKLERVGNFGRKRRN